MHAAAAKRAASYLKTAQRAFGERLVGLYVVGSAAIGGFRPRQSDLDLVAVLDGTTPEDIARIRSVHRRQGARALLTSVRNLNPDAGAANCLYLSTTEVSRPVSEIKAIGSHVGPQLHDGEAFDVNPVQWHTFAHHGVTVHGVDVSALGLRPQPELLRPWVLDNLNSYWAWSSQKCATGKSPNSYFHSRRWSTAWHVTGPARMHATIATGDVISKEAACDYALDTFEPKWHPVINEARSFLRGEASGKHFRNSTEQLSRAGQFGLHVIASANRL